MLSQITLLALFVVTAILVTTRPWQISEGWWPAAAVAVALVTGAVTIPGAARGFVSSLDVVSFFAGLLLLAWKLRDSNFLDPYLDWMEKRSGDSPRRLLFAVAVATVVVTALLSNDAAALLLAPAVFDRLVRRSLPLPTFAITVAFIANATSALLPVSNPVNLLILDRSHIELSRYLTAVTPGACLGVILTVAGCLLLAGRSLPARIPASRPDSGPSSVGRPRTRGLKLLLALLVVTDLAFAAARLPIGPPTLVAGVLAVMVVRDPGLRRVPPSGLGWAILALVAGFSVLASGLAHSAWLADAAGRLSGGGSPWGAGMAVGVITAVISGVVNNLPAALLVTSALQAGHHLGSLALTAIVGADLGPNLAPFGSLSTILILAAARHRRQPVSWRQLGGLGLAVGPAALIATLAVVALTR